MRANGEGTRRRTKGKVMSVSGPTQVTVVHVASAFESAFGTGELLRDVLESLADVLNLLDGRVDGPGRWTVSLREPPEAGVFIRVNISTGKQGESSSGLWMLEIAKDRPARKRCMLVLIDLRSASLEALQERFDTEYNQGRASNDRVEAYDAENGHTTLLHPVRVWIPAALMKSVYPLIARAHRDAIWNERCGVIPFSEGGAAMQGYRPAVLDYLATQLSPRCIPDPACPSALRSDRARQPSLFGQEIPHEPPPAQRATGRLGSVLSARGQGRLADAAERVAIEERAMEIARTLYETEGWLKRDDISDDVHRHNPYDLVFERDDSRVYVEVKGTTGYGNKINLTAGEVSHVNRTAGSRHLVVVEQIRVLWEDGQMRATGGDVCVHIKDWSLDGGKLRPTQYEWTVPLSAYRNSQQ